MRTGAILSAVLHLAVVLFAWIGWPLINRDRPLPEMAIPVEVVNLAPHPTPEPEKSEPKAEPKAEPKEAKAPPPPPSSPPPAPAPAAEQEAEAIPLPTKPAPPKPEPPKDSAKPTPQAEPQVRPVLKEKPAPPTKNLMANVLKTVEQLKQEAPKPEPAQKTSDAPQKDRQQISNVERARREQQLSDLVRQQIAGCWNVPIGAKDVQNMIVDIHMQLGPDGTVLRAEPVDSARMASDSFYRAFAESAIRAVRNPRCNPLKLPVDSYDIWRDMTLTFNPKDLV
ncbi:MAG: cell envelope integrity protein TolA [Alphaproteobacteria bacterium]